MVEGRRSHDARFECVVGLEVEGVLLGLRDGAAGADVALNLAVEVVQADAQRTGRVGDAHVVGLAVRAVVGLAGVGVGTTELEAAEADDQTGVPGLRLVRAVRSRRSEEHTSELQSLMRSSYAVFCLKKK